MIIVSINHFRIRQASIASTKRLQAKDDECEELKEELKRERGEKSGVQEDLRVTILETKRLRAEATDLKGELREVRQGKGSTLEMEKLLQQLDTLREQGREERARAKQELEVTSITAAS